jgi:hypothetical protein
MLPVRFALLVALSLDEHALQDHEEFRDPATVHCASLDFFPLTRSVQSIDYANNKHTSSSTIKVAVKPGKESELQLWCSKAVAQ